MLQTFFISKTMYCVKYYVLYVGLKGMKCFNCFYPNIQGSVKVNSYITASLFMFQFFKNLEISWCVVFFMLTSGSEENKDSV